MEPFSRMHKIMVDDGLNQQAMAEVLGVSKASISHFISGRNQPKLEAIKSFISHYPTVDIYYLLFGENRSPELADNSLEDLASVSEGSEELREILMIYKNGSFEKIIPKSKSNG